MSDIETLAAAGYVAARAMLKRVNVRHNGTEYFGTAAQTIAQRTLDTGRGAQEMDDGAVRLLKSELHKPWPAAQDTVHVQTEADGDWGERIVKSVRDERNGTIVVEYGDKYG